MKVLLLVVFFAAVVAAARRAEHPALAQLKTNLFEYRCNKCILSVEDVNNRIAATKAATAQCEADLAMNCHPTLNATADAACLAVAATVCANAASGVSPAQTCAAIGFCESQAPLPPTIGGFWGECGGCQDTISAGIEVSEEFLCEGLSGALSTFCFVGEPICDGVLETGCEYLVDYICDRGCMATWVCFHFGACGSGPTQSCCK